MADFLKVMKDVWEVEHNSNPRLILHHNQNERTYTFYGVYPYTKLKSYKRIDDAIKTYNKLSIASEHLAKDELLYQEVLGFYYLNFWKPMGLDNVISTHKASEIMVLIINIGIGRKERVVKIIQKIVGTKRDGILGKKTLKALNGFKGSLFDKLFDKEEIKFYKRLVRKYPRLKWALKGWISRANRI